MIDEKKIALACWNGNRNVFSFKFVEDSDDEMDHAWGIRRPEDYWKLVPEEELDRLLDAFGWEREEGESYWYTNRDRFGSSCEDDE